MVVELDDRHGEGLGLLGLAKAYGALGRREDAIRCYRISHDILLATADDQAAAQRRAGLRRARPRQRPHDRPATSRPTGRPGGHAP